MRNTYLLIREIRVHDANAMSSPLTVGFPAVTSFLGFMHALERNIRHNPAMQDITMKELAIACHEFQLKTFQKRNGKQLVINTKNPQHDTAKLGKPPSRTPEPRADMTVSLLINLGKSVSDLDEDREEFLHTVETNLCQMKLAGGDILGFAPFEYSDGKEKQESGVRCSGLLDLTGDKVSTRKGLRSLMPGFVLVERRDILQESKDTLDGFLDALSVHYAYEEANGAWAASRAQAGWIVPIAVGFKGLAQLGKVMNQRDPNKPHRFAEPILTLGEFKIPYHFRTLKGIMWHYQYKNENLYLCTNAVDVREEGVD